MKRTKILIASILCSFGIAVYSFAAADSPNLSMGIGTYHLTADRTLYHSNIKVHEAFGHAVMTAGSRRLSSDYVWIDTKSGDVKARGNVVFVSSLWTIQAAEMHFNMNTGNGSIFYGTVSNDNYRLRGQLIRKISEDRFLTTEGEYTTCKDCAESWKLAAKNVDMTIDGYAFMENVYVMVKDVPTLYLPYMIVPVKSRRQTGLLFPQVSAGSVHGFTYLQPFFLVIDDHQDATFTYGKYSKRGSRGEFQYRYKSYDGIQGYLNGFYVEDRGYKQSKDRFALKSEHDIPFSKYIDMKLRVNEVKDRDYVKTFQQDVAGLNLPATESSANLTSNFDNFFIGAEVKRYRSLMAKEALRFDTDMVQSAPSVYFSTRERKLFSTVSANVYGTFDHFYREAGGFLDANQNGVFEPFSNDRIRAVDRFMIAPEITQSWKVAKYLNLQPSVQYNERVHLFKLGPSTIPIEPLHSRYVQGKVQASTTVEKIYSLDSENFSKVKHRITPLLSYSNIPWFFETKSHPFSFQKVQDGGIFDQFDIIPKDNRPDSLREPVANALSFGLFSSLIRKKRTQEKIEEDIFARKKAAKKYDIPYNKKQEMDINQQKLWDKFSPDYSLYKQVWLVTVNQAYDIKEANRVLLPSDRPRAPYSPLLIRSIVSLDEVSKYLEYQYKPYGQYVVERNAYRAQHDFRIHGEWTLKSIMNPRGTLFFKRSVNAGFELVTNPNPSRKVNFGFTWSLNDNFAFAYSRGIDLLNMNKILRDKLNESISTIYSSPSECWQLKLNYEYKHEAGTQIGIDLAVNLMGTGYVGLGGAGDSPASGAGGVGGF